MRIVLLTACLTAAVAGPALAGEKVPDDAAGALAPWRGKFWSEPLVSCAGFHRFDEQRLAKLGRPTAAAHAAAREWWALAGVKVAEIDGIGVDEAMEALDPEIDFAASGAGFEASDEAKLAGARQTCVEIRSTYEKAG